MDYKVIGTSSFLGNSGIAYSGEIDFSNLPYNSYGAFFIDGSNDGTNWTNIGSISLGSQPYGGGPYTFVFNSQWQQIRFVIEGMYNYSASASGTATIKVYGVGADEQTVQNAASAAQGAQTAAQAAQSAAQNAQSAAQAAQTASQNALNNTNTIINSYLSTSAGVVQDSSGTVLTAARAAQAAAQNAVTGIQNAQNSLSNLSSKIDANQNALTNQLNSLQTAVTNNFNNLAQYLTPNLKKVSGYNGATATSGSSIRVVLDYSNATDYRYAVDGNWSAWTSLAGYSSTGYITVPLSSPGAHTITVQIRNGNGANAPTDSASMTAFKL
ncbi:hypothetical protein DNHGIG_40790 [Collibacillus ludicampi]|uniref:Uncharacterized protein n=2 Tax=Collibacillus ludicampi TaxID=2771369 RepID=A0AAV4LKV9_9BACL|nr:hypothetical protein DNHGIG_40790 [Collibacillus ludicampi]